MKKIKVSDMVTYSWLLAPNYREGKTVAEIEKPGEAQQESWLQWDAYRVTEEAQQLCRREYVGGPGDCYLYSVSAAPQRAARVLMKTHCSQGEGEAQWEGLGEDQAGLLKKEVIHISGRAGGEDSQKCPEGLWPPKSYFRSILREGWLKRAW